MCQVIRWKGQYNCDLCPTFSLTSFFNPPHKQEYATVMNTFIFCRKGPGDSLREKNIFPIGGGAEIRFSQTTSTRIHKYAPNLSHFYAVSAKPFPRKRARIETVDLDFSWTIKHFPLWSYFHFSSSEVPLGHYWDRLRFLALQSYTIAKAFT